MTLEIKPISDPELIMGHMGDTFSWRERAIILDFIERSAYVWAVESNGELLAFWGVIPVTLTSSTAYIWLYTMPELSHHTLAFARKSREVTAAMLGVYDRIIGHCIESALASHRWLRWCGASFGEPFRGAIPFEIKAK